MRWVFLSYPFFFLTFSVQLLQERIAPWHSVEAVETARYLMLFPPRKLHWLLSRTRFGISVARRLYSSCAYSSSRDFRERRHEMVPFAEIRRPERPSTEATAWPLDYALPLFRSNTPNTLSRALDSKRCPLPRIGRARVANLARPPRTRRKQRKWTHGNHLKGLCGRSSSGG